MADNLGSLYGAVSQKFDIGSEADFRAKMQTTEDRKKFYDAVSGKGFDLGDYNAYETRLGEVKKKEPTESTTSVSAEPVSQDTKPSEQVGTDNVLELPKSYQYNRNNKSELQVGKAYQTTPREIKRWTGDHFEKNPDASPLKSLVDFSVKGIKGIAPEAMEKLDSLPSGIGDKKANIAEAYRQTSKVQDEAAGLAMQNKLLTSFAPVQQLNQLNEEYALAPEDKKVEIQKKIDELANRPITNSDFVGTRFSKGDLNVSQNFTPTVKAGQKLEEYDGEEPSNVVPEKIKTVGDAYAKAKQNEEFIKDAQAESFTLNSITKTEQQKLLSPDQIAMIDAIPDPQAREDEFQKQLDLSKTDAAVSTSFLRGMNNTMEGLFNVGKYAGMEPKELNAEMERDYYKQQLFSVQPEGLAAKTAEGIGGMVPDMALSLVGGTPAMLASMSARHPQEALKQYYFDKFSKGETPDYNEAWKFATISTAINTSIFGGASLVGGGAMPISGTVKQAALDFLTGTVKNAAKDAAIFGLGGKAIQDLNSNAFDVEHDNNYIQAGIEMGVFGGVMYGLTHAPAIIRSKWSQAKINKAIDVSSFMPPDVTAKMIQDGQENGFITPQEATEIELRQARVRQIVNQFPKELTIEQIQEIEPLWAEKDRLSSQMKEASPVMKKILAGKISELDEKALIKGAVPLTAEEKAEYKDLITAEATEGGKTDKSRLTYLRKRMEAASTEKQSKKEADAKESSKGGDGEDAKPEAETGAENLAEGGKEEVVAEVVEPKIEGTDLTNSEAIKFLDDHVVDGPIQKLELHPDFELNSEELARGIKQIREGKFEMAGAKKVLAKIDEWKRLGYVDYMRGAGKQIQKTSLPFDMTEALAQLPKEQAEAVIQAENELEANTGIDEALKNFTDKDGNLDLAKLSEELKNAKEPNYWGDLLGLNEEELTNLQNIIDNEQSKKATDSASPKSENQNDAKPESNIGKEIAFKHAGQTVKGKIESIDENGNYRVVEKGKGKSPDTKYRVKPSDVISSEQSSTQKFYEDVAGSAPNNQTGRIPVDPIIGGTTKKLSEIIFDLTKNTKQRVFFSKLSRRNSLGTYSPGNSAIKIKFNGDLDTTAHELGHSIDDHFGILSDLASTPNLPVEQELNKFSPFGSKPPAGHPNPRLYEYGEGFAEFLRAYIVNPKEAKAQAPELTKLYESKTSAEYQKAVTEFSNDIRSWAGSSGRDITLANIEMEPTKKTLMGKILSSQGNNEFVISWVDKLAANFVDPLAAFNKAFEYARTIKDTEVLPADDPRILARLLLGVDGKYGEILQHGMIDGKNNVLKDANGEPKNLEWLLRPLDNTDQSTIKKDMEDVVAYMVSERTVELADKFDRETVLSGVGGGIFKDVDVAKKTLDEFNNGDPNRLARIKEAADRYRELSDDILKYMVDKGRMSKEDYNEIKKNNLQYVAMMRVMESEPNREIQTPVGSGGKLGSKSEPIKKQTGSTKMIENPYSSLIKTLHKAINEADRNEVLRSFRDMLVEDRSMYQDSPKRFSDIGVIGKEGDKNAVTIFIDGKPEHWIFQEDVHNAIKGLGAEVYKLPGIITAFPMMLRWSVTHFPVFAARNIARDFQDRIIKSNEGSGMRDVFGDKEHWREIARTGGLNSGYYMKNKESYYGLLEEAMHDISKNTTVFDPIKFKELWRNYTDLLTKSETVNRVAEYRAAFKNAKAKGMDDYNASLYAGYKARDLMDFAVMGEQMKWINQIVPFSNASIQGLRKAAVSAKENPIGFTSRMIAYTVAPSIGLWLLNHRDEKTAKQYEAMPWYQRDMAWNFKIGINKWASIPKPYELSLFGSAVDRTLSKVFYGKENAFEGYGGSVANTMLPIDQANLIPVAPAIVEGMMNYDMFRDKSIVPPYENNVDLSLRNTDQASRLGNLLQEASMNLPGGGVDARKTDHFIKGQFSYFGNTLLKASNIGNEKGEQFGLSDLGFFKETPAYNSPDVQKLMEYAEQWRLGSSRTMKEFHRLAKNYFNEKDDAEKEKKAEILIDYSKRTLKIWKEKNMDEIKKERAERKKK